jgi:hypothetical protein
LSKRKQKKGQESKLFFKKKLKKRKRKKHNNKWDKEDVGFCVCMKGREILKRGKNQRKTKPKTM